MSADETDAPSCEHIQERIGRVEACAQEGREAFDASPILQDAVMRNFEVIGEAVNSSLPIFETGMQAWNGAEWRAFEMCLFTITWGLTLMKCGT